MAFEAWRALTIDEQRAYLAARNGGAAPIPVPAFDAERHKRLKLLVLECDYRGARVECSCAAEFRVCLAGKGRRRSDVDYADVSERDCLACQGE